MLVFSVMVLQNLLTLGPWACCDCLQMIAWLLSVIASQLYKNMLELYFIC